MRRAIAIGVAVIIAAVLLPAAPALAAQPTSTTYEGPSALSIDFGDDWLFTVHVTSSYPGVEPTGTVSLFADGLSAPLVRDEPLQAGGLAYLAVPDTSEPLAPGEYSLTAIYSPSAGSYLESSKTRRSATLTIAPVELEASATLSRATGETLPTVTTSLSGDWLDRFGPPAGEWAVAVLDSTRAKVYSGGAVQPTGVGAATGVDLPLDFSAQPDTEYEVIVAFYPSSTSASGIDTGAPVQLSFTTEAPTLIDAVTAPVPTPTWVIGSGFVALVLLIGMLALGIVLRVRDRRSRYIAATRGGNRLTSRILLYGPDGRVLLFLTKAPDSSGIARWITPGGGVDPGESHDEAAVRELFEETGLHDIPLHGPVYAQDFTVEWDEADHSTGHVEFYVAETEAFDPSDEHWTDEERVDVLAHGWFTAEEIDDAAEPFEPLALPDLIRRFRPAQTGASGTDSMDA